MSTDLIKISLKAGEKTCLVEKIDTSTSKTTVGTVSVEDLSEIFSTEKTIDIGFIQNLLGVSSRNDSRATFFYYPSITVDISLACHCHPFQDYNTQQLEFNNHIITYDSERNILKISNVEFKNNIAIIVQDGIAITKTFFGNYLPQENSIFSNMITNDTLVARYPLYNYFAGHTVCWPSGFNLAEYYNNFNKQSTLIHAYLSSVFNFDLNYNYLKTFYDRSLSPESKASFYVFFNKFNTLDQEFFYALAYLLSSPEEKLNFAKNFISKGPLENHKV